MGLEYIQVLDSLYCLVLLVGALQLGSHLCWGTWLGDLWIPLSVGVGLLRLLAT